MRFKGNILHRRVRTRIANDLWKRLETDKMYLNIGFVGTACLCRALSESGFNDYAYTLPPK